MQASTQFIICIAAVVLAVIVLKVFSTFWRTVHKRFHPEDIRSAVAAPEVAFRDLQKRSVDVYMKNGEEIRDCRYARTLLFGDGEFATCTVVYFQFRTSEDADIFISGHDILRMEAKKKT